MTASMRSRVDLPAPLWPTSPTRSPSRSDRVMSGNASMLSNRWSVPILPPTLPSTAFFSDRVLASKIGKSTDAFQTSMLTMCSRPHSHPVGHSGPVVAHGEHRQCPPDNGDPADDSPTPPVNVLADQRRTQDLHEVVERVELKEYLRPGPIGTTAAEQVVRRPHDG